MRGKKALVESRSARQLDLFAEAVPESERARAEPVDAINRRRRPNAILEVLPPPPTKPSTPSRDSKSTTARAALIKHAADGHRTFRRLAVSPGEAAEMLGVSRDYFDEHVISELRVVRRGRRILIAFAELERWLDRSATRASVGRA
jgi:excisionase family DNA binding protein